MPPLRNVIAEPAAENSKDTSTYPLAALIEGLSNPSLEARVNAIKNIPKIALELGDYRTRSELIPFLTETLCDDDEVLIEIAEQMGNFAYYVGGMDFEFILLDPLEPLASSESSVVRAKAVEILHKLGPMISDTYFEKFFFSLVMRLAIDDAAVSRLSAVDLFPTCYQRVDDISKAKIITCISYLYHDVSPVVREAVPGGFIKLADGVQHYALINDVLVWLTYSVREENESHLNQAIRTCVGLLVLLPEEYILDYLVPAVRGVISGESSRFPNLRNRLNSAFGRSRYSAYSDYFY